MAHPAQYGFTDSIPKPYVLQQLADLLNRHFSPG
jgi:hypothetical protein